MTTTKADIDRAYAWCQQLAKSHYENFPVASVLLPDRLRRPIAAIYAFARTADDFADEGNAPQSERLAKLNEYSLFLQQIKSNQYDGDNLIFIALQDTVRQFSLPMQLFEDLLIAFRQDVVKSRYANFAEVLDLDQDKCDLIPPKVYQMIDGWIRESLPDLVNNVLSLPDGPERDQAKRILRQKMDSLVDKKLKRTLYSVCRSLKILH